MEESPTTQFDESLIGPLSASRIGTDPVSWGNTPHFTYADHETEAWVEDEVKKAREAAQGILRDELVALAASVQSQSEPQSLLHGLLAWGDCSVTELAGYLGQPVGLTELMLDALSIVGAVVPGRCDEYGDMQYHINPDAAAAAFTS